VSPFRSDQAPQFPLLAECLRFFDHYLKEEPTGLEAEAPVHYFTLGEERWHAADGWPPAAVPKMLHLAPDQTLTTAPPDGTAADAYRADYSCGTGAHTRYERLAAFAVETYYDDWQGRDARMLTYTSPPLEDAVRLTGHPVVTIHLAADQRDANWPYARPTPWPDWAGTSSWSCWPRSRIRRMWPRWREKFSIV
jgi:putative CocE/NonD family hydrolase